MDVMPLKYGAVFKHTFSQPEIFCRFASDVLDIDIKVDEVHTEYEYPEPIGFVRSKYDLFAEDTDRKISSLERLAWATDDGRFDL